MVIHKLSLDKKLRDELVSFLDYDKNIGFFSSPYILLNIELIKQKNWHFATTYESQLIDLSLKEDGAESKDATNLFNALSLFNINNVCIIECCSLFLHEEVKLTYLSNIDLSTIQNLKFIENSYGYDDYILIFNYSLSFLILLPPLVDKIFIAGDKDFIEIACSDDGWVFNAIIN